MQNITSTTNAPLYLELNCQKNLHVLNIASKIGSKPYSTTAFLKPALASAPILKKVRNPTPVTIIDPEVNTC